VYHPPLGQISTTVIDGFSRKKVSVSLG